MKKYTTDKIKISNHFLDEASMVSIYELIEAGSHLSQGYTKGINKFVELTNDQTISGVKTFTNNIVIKGNEPTISFIDSDLNASDFFAHTNNNSFYVLSDRDDSGSNNGLTGWDGSHPLQLNSDTNKAYTFGNEIWHSGNHGIGSGLDADKLHGFSASEYLRKNTNGEITGALTISGSVSAGGSTGASQYHSGADNLILKGNSRGESGIFFQSEKDGTNINHTSDFGFIQYHSYGTLDSGEANELIIGVSNDSDDNVILNAPSMSGLKFRSGDSATDYTIYHSGNIPIWNQGTTGTAAKATTANKVHSGYTGDLNTTANQNTAAQLTHHSFSGSAANKPPTSDNANSVITVGQHSGNYNAQLAFSSNGNMYWRDNPSTSFGSWRTVYDSGNIPTWNQDTTGIAANASNASLIDGIDSNRIVYGSGANKTNTVTNINTALPSGFYDISAGTGTPTNTWYTVINQRHVNTDNHFGSQIATSFFSNEDMYVRTVSNGTYKPWSRIWNEANDGSGSGLDADKLDGYHLSTGTRNDVANKVVKTDGNGFINAGWINTTSGNTTSTLSDIYVNTNDGYIRKSTPSHFRSQITDGHYVKQNEDIRMKTIRFTGEGGNSGNGAHNYAIYQAGGGWSHPYPDLVIGFHTGIKIGGYYGYGGTRFYNDTPERANSVEIFSVGNGDNNVRVKNTLYVTNDSYARNFILNSDIRLKEDIKKVENNHIDIDWKTFVMKSEKDQKRYGVIAQELEVKNPEFVRTDAEGIKSVAYIDLLIAKIAELEARLEKAGI